MAQQMQIVHTPFGRHLVPAAVGALLADRTRTYPADFFSSLGLGLGLALVLASPGFPSSVLGNSWHSRFRSRGNETN